MSEVVSYESLIPQSFSQQQDCDEKTLTNKPNYVQFESAQVNPQNVKENNDMENQDNNNSTSNSTSDVKPPTSRRRTKKELMLFEKMNIKHPGNPDERLIVFVPVESWDTSITAPTEAEKWLTGKVREESLPTGEYLIVQKIKGLALQEEKQIIIKEI